MTFKRGKGYWARFKANRPESVTPEYKKWRAAVLIRDKRTCVVCHKKRNLRVHHLFSWASHPQLRYMVENGVTVCNFCHTLFHNIYGRGRNTPMQFDNFKGRYANIVAFEKKLKRKK